MLGDVLRARYHWDRGETEKALGHLHRLLGGGDTSEAFCWTAADIQHYARLPFEIAIATILLAEDVFFEPFGVGFTRLWQALPLQYLIWLLSQRKLDREQDAAIVDVLSHAAESGLLSTRRADYDLSGKVVLDPEAEPEIAAFVGASLIEQIEQASVADAWSRVIAPNADLVIDGFLYAVFHREPANRPAMILARLGRIADSNDSFLRAFAGHFSARLTDPANHEPLVSIGLRIDPAVGASACLAQFSQALASRELEPFVTRYYPDV